EGASGSAAHGRVHEDSSSEAMTAPEVEPNRPPGEQAAGADDLGPADGRADLEFCLAHWRFSAARRFLGT
ncbi:MAG TPA: hypothetical protein VK977_02775, partial [Actinomycetota bacterium]|nr:hypothetical protein [Actinomycetota bacterium]